MKYEDVRAALGDIDDELFAFVWHMFDIHNTGHVFIDEFVAAIALLMAPEKGDTTIDQQIETAFAMFDTKGDGKLTYIEFRSMLEITVTLNLQRVVETEAGTRALEAHMRREHNEENLLFWREVRAYRDGFGARSAVNSVKLANEIITRFVVPGTDEEVNLPGPVAAALLNTDQNRASSDKKEADFKAPSPELVTADLFQRAEKEIFTLMENDAFARFKKDPTAVGQVVDDFWQQASGDGSNGTDVHFGDFKAFVLKQPAILVFLTQLSTSIAATLTQYEAKKRQSRAFTDSPIPSA